MSLTANAVQQLYNSVLGLTPDMQVIGIKEIPNTSGAAAKRYR